MAIKKRVAEGTFADTSTITSSASSFNQQDGTSGHTYTFYAASVGATATIEREDTAGQWSTMIDGIAVTAGELEVKVINGFVEDTRATITPDSGSGDYWVEVEAN